MLNEFQNYNLMIRYAPLSVFPLLLVGEQVVWYEGGVDGGRWVPRLVQPPVKRFLINLISFSAHPIPSLEIIQGGHSEW